MEERINILESGFHEILELIEENAELGGGFFSPEEVVEKIMEISQNKLMGEV